MLSAATLPAALAQVCRARASVPFLLVEEGTDWTYRDVDHRSDQLAAGLLAVGVRPGDRIAIAAPNSPEWIVTWFAAAKLGVVLVTLNVAYREREFEYMLNQSGSSMLICIDEFRGFDFVEFLEGLRRQIPTVRHFVTLGRRTVPGGVRWNELLVPEPDVDRVRAASADVQPDDPAVVLYTSGTTGDPKGAVLTHRSILASASAQIDRLGQRPDDVSIGQMPLNHVGGMTCTLAASMVAGGSVALLTGYHPRTALDTTVERRVTLWFGVPTMYAMMLALPEFANADTSCVRICVIGGSNVEPELGKRIIDVFGGARLANLYGLSETSGGSVISAPDDDLDTLFSTIGTPTGDFAVRVVDDEGTVLPPETEGELQITGACVAAGYWERPDETAATFRPGGWLATGDMAVLRPDGRIALRGRKKEMYVRGGYNVYPAEIENVLAEDAGVVMCAVIGVPHDLFGETGRAYVVPAPGSVVDIDGLLDRCRRRLASYKVPDEIVVVESLPLTPSGKVKKVALRESEKESLVTAEQNKELVRRACSYIDTRDFDALMDVLSDDATWELPNRKDRFEYGGPNDKEGTYKLLSGFLTPFETFSFEVRSLTAEGDRVAVEAVSHGIGPGTAEYRNNYVMMWTIADGKVCSVKEALDPFQVLAYVEQLQSQ